VTARVIATIDDGERLILECPECEEQYDEPVRADGYVPPTCDTCYGAARAEMTYVPAPVIHRSEQYETLTIAECSGCGEHWDTGAVVPLDEGLPKTVDCPPCARRWPS
jgi:hypothetical protein